MANGNIPELITGTYFEPAALDLSEVGSTLPEIMGQMQAYKRRKKELEQERKKVQWNRFMSLYDVPPVSAIQEKNQEDLNEIYDEYVGELTSLADRMEAGEDYYKIEREGRTLQNKYLSKAEKIRTAEQAWATERQMIMSDPDKYEWSGVQNNINYKGGEYMPGLRITPLDPAADVSKLASTITQNNFYEFAELTKITNTGQIVSARKQWKDGIFYTGEKMEETPYVDIAIRGRLSDNRVKMGTLHYLKVLGKETDTPGVYEFKNKLYSTSPHIVKVNEKPVYTIEDFYKHAYFEPRFKPKPQKVVEEVSEDFIGDTGGGKSEIYEVSDQNYRSWGKDTKGDPLIETDSYIDLSREKIAGTASFQEETVYDPETGKIAMDEDGNPIKGTRDYKVVGVAPDKGFMIVQISGYVKATSPEGGVIQFSRGQLPGIGEYKDLTQFIKEGKEFIIPITTYRGMLRGIRLVEKGTNNVILEGGQGIRERPKASPWKESPNEGQEQSGKKTLNF
jgi:hypothetical protein